MTPDFETYRESFLLEVQKITRNSEIHRPAEYVQLHALQRCCLHKRLSLADFLSRVDKDSEVTGAFVYITLPDVMMTVDYYREQANLSKRKLSLLIPMDVSNFMKMYRQGRSVNMKTFFDISSALGVSPSVFMHQCEKMKLQDA